MMEKQISVFKSVASKQPVAVTPQQVAQAIINGKYRTQVEAVRAAVAQGDKALASRHKAKLVYICYTGVCRGGHKAEQLHTYRPCCVLDYDNLPVDQLSRLRDRVMQEPCVEMAYISASGTGLKVVVITNATREQHPQAYVQVADYFDGLTGFRCDRACRDITHGQFASYDADATFREVTEPFAVCAQPSENRIEPSALSAQPSESCIEPLPYNAPQHAALYTSAHHFVQSYLTLYPAYETTRNTSLFKLACRACKRGIDKGQLLQATTQYMLQPGFDAYEIAQVVNSAYSREASAQGVPPGEEAGTYSHVIAKEPLAISTTAPAEDEGVEMPDGEELRAYTPLFPEEVYRGIPEFLSTVVKHHPEGRERDMLLLSSVTMLSSLFYTTWGYYDSRRCFANLYTFVVAPAGSKKSVTNYGLDLCKHFFEEAARNNDELENKHNRAMDAYEYAMRQMRRSKSKDVSPEEIPQKPESPVYYHPQVPTSISYARLTEHIQHNGVRGGLMFDSEADTLSAATGKDYGNFLDAIRKMYHHEKITSSYKAAGRARYIHQPKFSLMLNGTPAQVARLFGTTENGGYSRFLIYTFLMDTRWHDPSLQGNDESLLERHFDTLSMRLHQMLRFLHASSLRVTLSRNQWRKFNTTFAALLDNERFNERADFQTCVKRYALMVFRICMVFTSLEKAALGMDVCELQCSDAHFEAALSMVTTCLEHSRLVITSLKYTDKDVQELQNPNKLHNILADLPAEFTSAQYYALAARHEMPKRTAVRLINRAVGKLVNKLSRGVYCKV